MNHRHWLGTAALAGTALLLLDAAGTARLKEEQLARHRNLGKALYENPTTQVEAVDELRKALDLDPNSARDRLNYGLAMLRAGKTKEGIAEIEKVQKQDPKIPHTWFNLGIAFKKDGDYARSAQQFEQMVKLVPDEPISHYNLGVLYRLIGRQDEALRQFETARKLDPNLGAARFQLYNAYRRIGRGEDAAKELQTFQQIKKRQEGAAVPEDVDWSFYGELYDVVDPAWSADAGKGAALKFQAAKLAGALDAKTAGLAVFEAGTDGIPDLLAWSSKGITLYRSGLTPLAASGLGELRGVISASIADYNNDGLQEMCVLTETGPVLLANRGGKFAPAGGLPGGRFNKAAWLDYDHDGDLDLFLLGDKQVLLRNQGDAGFADRTSDFSFVPGRALDADVFRLVADGKGMEMVVSYQDRAGVLYRDRFAGKYEAVPLEGLPAGSKSLAAVDVDNDSWIDVAASSPSGVVLMMNRQGKMQAAKTAVAGGSGIAWADLENRGVADLVAGNAVHRNQGLARFASAVTPSGFPASVAWAAADFDKDGRTDLAAVAADGGIRRLLNVTATGNQWTRVKLTGIKNLKLALGSEVEVKAGTRYQKKTYQGLPLLFGLGAAKEVDTVRITWPNGLIQNEPKQIAGKQLAYEEAQRLSGSCPMIFTWNGREFQFITDVLGVAPLGATAGDGEYFPVDHDEYIRIPGEALAPAEGRYEIRITEELREVSYLDQIRLVAVDHPGNIEVYTNDKFKSPPFPEFRLFGVTRRVHPVSARDGHGRDVLDRVLRRDRAYPDGFRRTYSGVAEQHSLELDFGPRAALDNRAVLVLSGWVDWADGSTFLGASQEGKGGLLPPFLQVKDARGEWRTVIEDMGIPAGKPKAIVVDLGGKFLSASREIRIVTNLCVYWDEIFLSEEGGAPEVRMTDVARIAAGLRFRGFSHPIIHPKRTQPEAFNYARVESASMWNPTPGLYTRYGDVRELLGEIDDRTVIMGSGDELRLQFDAGSLPPVPQGWRRDFLLHVDGWAKDGDLNTAYSQTVEPLPFHGMSSYPYPAGERFPETEAHRRWMNEYNTRPALRLIRPLARLAQMRATPVPSGKRR
jgi:tetratricopeptide (TPR) repeat protein